jgi:glycosyltransferase involved in cell wall biosynthesis
MKEKVLIISSVHRWNDPRIFYKQAVSLAMRYAVELHAVADFETREEEGVTIVGLPRLRRLFRPLNWWRLLVRAIRSEARIVHFHDPELLPLGLMLRIFGKRVIYDVHEDFPASIYSKEWIRGRRIFAALADRVEKWLSRKMSALVFAEAYYKENFTRVRVPQVDILNYPVFSGGVDRNPPQDVFNLVYAGGISVPRGALTMVEAVGLLPAELRERTKLVLIGDIAPDLAAKMEAKAAEYGIGKQLICSGRVSLQEVYQWYGRCHLGLAVLHPEKNYIKSLATKIFEYMSVGIPVVASNFPLWVELVSGNQCGYNADPLDSRDVAAKIAGLLAKPELMAQMGRQGYQAFQEKYNWDVEVKKLYSLYDRILGTDGGVEND